MAMQTDSNGRNFETSNGAGPTHCNTPIQVYTPQGLVPGNWTGTHAEPNKK